jgi:outer membrane protein assembly factor BamA
MISVAHSSGLRTIYRLAILTALLTGIRAQNGPFPLESVYLEGTSLTRDSVLEIADLRIGSPVDQAAIEAGCARLKDSGLFESINYRYAPGPKNGYAVTLTLSDQSLLSAFFDLPGIDESELWTWLISLYPRFDHRVPGTDAAQAFIAKKVEKHLGEKLDGQHIVARMETDLGSGKSILSFQPEILPRITALNFTGASELKPAELARLLEKVVGDQGYTARRFRQAVELNLRRAYEERGMCRVKFPSITVQKTSPSSVAVTTAIEEGSKYKLGQVQIIGDNLPVDAMLKVAKFRKGGVANWTDIQAGIWELEKPVRRAGYLNAKAIPERVFHDDQLVLDLKISLSIGPLYHFGESHFSGLGPALEARARKIWTMKPGDPFDYAYPNDFFQDFFRAVDSRQFKKFGASMQKGAGEQVMDFTLTFETR